MIMQLFPVVRYQMTIKQLDTFYPAPGPLLRTIDPERKEEGTAVMRLMEISRMNSFQSFLRPWYR